VGATAENLALMRLIDAQFLETPWYGSRQMARHGVWGATERKNYVRRGHMRLMHEASAERKFRIANDHRVF
jgi:hypothetical protein